MKRALTLSLGVLALAGTVATANAADLPVLKAPVAPKPFSWTGCYVGGNVGWARAEHDLTTLVPASSNMNAAAIATIQEAGLATISDNGWTGGGQIGCNWQVQNVVFGVEADANFLDLSASRDTGNVISSTAHVNRSLDSVTMNWLATIRGRVGYTTSFLIPNLLVYGTFGAAFTEIKATKDFRWDFTDGCPIVAGLQSCHIGGASFSEVGLVLGNGFELPLPFDTRWSLKGEYLWAHFPGDPNMNYTTFNRGTIFTPPVLPQPANHTISTNLHVARIGLNFRFWP